MDRETKRKLQDAVKRFPPLNTILGYLVPPANNLLETGAGFFSRSSHNLYDFELSVEHADGDLMFFHADSSYDGVFQAYSIYAVDAANVIVGGHTWMENDRFMVRDLFHTVDARDVRYLIQVCTTRYLFGWWRPVIACTIYQPPCREPDGFQTLLGFQPVNLFLRWKPENMERIKREPLYGALRADIDKLCTDFTRWADSRTKDCPVYSLNDTGYGHPLLNLWLTEDSTGGSLITEVEHGTKQHACEVRFKRKTGFSLFEFVGINGTIAAAQAVLKAAEKSPKPAPVPQESDSEERPKFHRHQLRWG